MIELPRRVPGASTAGPAPTRLVPLYVHPLEDPQAWDAEALAGATVVVNVHDGPGLDGPDEAYAAVTARLAEAGVPMLGYVDLGHAARPIADIVADVEGWTAYPMSGVFLDQCPTEAEGVGKVALAVRVARRAGLFAGVLNPGAPTDPVFRDLGVPICVFEGAWDDYQEWTGEGSRPGDGHLIHSVPPWQLEHARRVMAWRGAGFGLVTDRWMPNPWQGLPSDAPRPLAVVPG
ncbi:spherulation-specific family 4 protein [Asanoa sp. WMMD1127]|uniref:spherulation-specific family 4 protein n=1 Tax=Asanoa sp. WMMD1127 TaxID=3016107 RepID=UPI002416922F|nr:spherulation-specific family 4 protein [Asanoa sp. WMMD1127]MDG4823548.1 spherulation-specific family 4 protein [Asanoa sp. WMMD1127]